jgi:cyclic di-GMP phosphodiesterase
MSTKNTLDNPSLFRSKRIEPASILIADDNLVNQELLKDVVVSLGHIPTVVNNGHDVIKHIEKDMPDMILLDLMMPKMNGFQVLKVLKSKGLLDELPVIIITSVDKLESIAACIRIGAKDYLVKPFDRVLLQARIQASIERKQTLKRLEQYYDLITDFNEILEQRVKKQVEEISQSHFETIFAMSKLAESRDTDTGEHLERIRAYCKLICRVLQKYTKFKFEITDQYIESIYIASPLHDIGKIGTPDNILLKEGKLTDEEFEHMKEHTTIGANTLREVHQQHPNNLFIRIGIEIAESHHEKWDGSGYPNGHKKKDIPLSARILALADVYDALTAKRCYKPAFSHEKSTAIIVEGREKHFDPDVVDAFLKCESTFHEIKNRYRDGL